MNKKDYKYFILFTIVTALLLIILLWKSTKKTTPQKDNFKNYTNTIYQKSFTDPNKALFLLDSLLSNRTNKTEESALLFFLMGEINILNGQYKAVLENTSKAYNYYKNTNETYTTGLCLITLSSAYAHLEQYEEAQKVALEALQLAEKITNLRLIGKVYNRLFSLHIALNDYDIALQYILKSDSIFTNLHDTASLSACKNNIGALYLKKQEFDEAIKYFKQAKNLHLTEKDKRPLISTFNNLGYTYMQAKDYKNAIQYLHQSISLNNEITGQINPAPYKGLGRIFEIMNQADSCSYYYTMAYEIYSKESRYSDMINILNNLVSAHFIYEDYKGAIQWQALRDSVQNISWAKEKEELLSFANVKYEVLKKEQQVLQQKQENRSNHILFVSISVSLLILIFALIVMYSNLRLRSQKNTAELEQKLLRIQMNPHFIFNTLAAIQNIILEGDNVKSTKVIAKFSRLMRQTFEYVRREQISLEQEKSMIQNYIETQQARFNFQFTYALNIDPTIDIEKVKIPPMLLQPFIENAIEYGLRPLKWPGELKIEIDKEDCYLQFKVQDNGIGRDKMKKFDQTENEIHATDIFLSRLKRRRLGEEKSFEIIDLYKLENEPAGTLIKFKLKIND
jgi:tetratricopeptide (TPR) repeat protein